MAAPAAPPAHRGSAEPPIFHAGEEESEPLFDARRPPSPPARAEGQAHVAIDVDGPADDPGPRRAERPLGEDACGGAATSVSVHTTIRGPAGREDGFALSTFAQFRQVPADAGRVVLERVVHPDAKTATVLTADRRTGALEVETRPAGEPLAAPPGPASYALVAAEGGEEDADPEGRLVAQLRRRNQYLAETLRAAGVEVDAPEEDAPDDAEFRPRGRRFVPAPSLLTWGSLAGRLAWLESLMMLLSVSSYILDRFQTLLADQPVLVDFIPVLIGSIGNTGSIVSVALHRAMMERSTAATRSHLKRELCASLFVAAVLTGSLYVRVVAEYPRESVAAAVIAATLFVGVVVAAALSVLFTVGLERLLCCANSHGAIPLLNTIIDLLVIALLCGIAEATWAVS